MAGVDFAREEKAAHSPLEMSNVLACHQLVDRWMESEYPSSNVIKTLHQQLFQNSDYERNGSLPTQPGEFRSINVRISGRPENFVAKGTQVRLLMDSYCQDLDDILSNENKLTLEQTVQSAAWAYETFERIHPFLDGNGRVGRMILKRILKKAGLKDLVFFDERWSGNNKSSHLDSLAKTDDYCTLMPLEVYILELLLQRYSKKEETYKTLSDLLRRKKKELSDFEKNDSVGTLADIWGRFRGTGLYADNF